MIHSNLIGFVAILSFFTAGCTRVDLVESDKRPSTTMVADEPSGDTKAEQNAVEKADLPQYTRDELNEAVTSGRMVPTEYLDQLEKIQKAEKKSKSTSKSQSRTWTSLEQEKIDEVRDRFLHDAEEAVKRGQMSPSEYREFVPSRYQETPEKVKEWWRRGK